MDIGREIQKKVHGDIKLTSHLAYIADSAVIAIKKWSNVLYVPTNHLASSHQSGTW